jgi:hypothetical protein
MTQAGDFEAALEKIYTTILDSIKRFAPGWSEFKLKNRIRDIKRFCISNSDAMIPPNRRRKISRLARELRDELDGLGGLDASFRDTLRDLAAPTKVRTGRGGDRTSGERGLEQHVLGMATRLYIEACDTPGFSKNGPLFRFANGVGELALGKPGPFTNDAVKAEFRRTKARAPKRISLKTFYQSQNY